MQITSVNTYVQDGEQLNLEDQLVHNTRSNNKGKVTQNKKIKVLVKRGCSVKKTKYKRKS